MVGEAVVVVFCLLKLSKQCVQVFVLVHEQLLQVCVLNIFDDLVETYEASPSVVFDFQNGVSKLDNQVMRVQSRDLEASVLGDAWKVKLQVNMVSLLAIEYVGLCQDL